MLNVSSSHFDPHADLGGSRVDLRGGAGSRSHGPAHAPGLHQSVGRFIFERVNGSRRPVRHSSAQVLAVLESDAEGRILALANEVIE
jgi:hypothetical protein